MTETLEELDPRLLEALAHPDAGTYPGVRAAQQPEHVQTHLSHVFLTADRVYKLHKPVAFDFVDFRSRKLRNEDSLREVRYNRRLAPDVYLGVAPLWLEGGRARLGAPANTLGNGEQTEHCVVMRRLPAGRDALSLLERGTLETGHIAAAARLVARFHERVSLGRPAPFSAEEWQRRTTAPLHECFAALGSGALAPRAARLESLARARFAADWPRFEQRRRDGRAVEAHGDLHLQHLWYEQEQAEPLVIDCITFNDELRRIDAASDVAFLAMDLRYRGETRLAEHFLSSYAAETGDHDLYGVADVFIGYRAAVRAKVAHLASHDAELEREQRERAAHSAEAHLELVEQTLTSARPGRLVLLTGLVGTGKSSVAAALALAARGVVISSDRVRKQLAGLGQRERGGASLYSDTRTLEVYGSLLERARKVLASGRVAVLDATYAQRARRDELRRAVEDLGVEPLLVETHCATPTVLQRLELRKKLDRDSSDAGPTFYAESARRYEPPDEWPAAHRVRIRTDREDWSARVQALARRLESAP